jgi:Ser/Thr protein kinase RdoA (MazF antagonist)
MDHMKNLQDRLAAYVDNRLLGRLGLASRPFVLEPAHAGMHSQVFFLTVEAERQLVLKIIGKRQRFRSMIGCSHHLASRGIDVPEILFADEDSRFFNRRGMHVVCEERICGETLQHSARPPELLAELAGFFARMHCHTRAMWGDIEHGSRSGLFGYLYKKCAARVRDWASADTAATPALQKRLLALLAHGEEAVNRIAVFSLCHCDPNPNNIIVRASDRKLFLLDAGTIRYLPRAIDYFMLQAYFCFRDREQAPLFERAYMSHLSDTALGEFADSQNFFRLYVAVLFMHDLTTRFAALPKDSPYHDEFASLIPQAQKALMEILDSNGYMQSC